MPSPKSCTGCPEMSNRRKIDLIKLAAVLDRPPPLTRLPDRRVRACCASRQGSAHLPGCTRTHRVPAPPPAIAAALHTAGTYQMAGMSLTGSLALASMEHSDEIAAWMNSDEETPDG